MMSTYYRRKMAGHHAGRREYLLPVTVAVIATVAAVALAVRAALLAVGS